MNILNSFSSAFLVVSFLVFIGIGLSLYALYLSFGPESKNLKDPFDD